VSGTFQEPLSKAGRDEVEYSFSAATLARTEE